MKISFSPVNNKFTLSFWTICFVFITAFSVAAATYQVSNTADSGTGSLRQAVADANATSADDTINFNIASTDSNCAANGVCTITLTGGVIKVQATGGALTIANQTGAGRLLISGNNASRVFETGDVDVAGSLTLDGITVTRGVSGGFSGSGVLGVVRNFRGTLTIMNSVFTENTGGVVIYSEFFGGRGNLNISNTTVDNNAGIGIYFTNLVSQGGTANIINSTISNNTATSGNGGGIYFLGEKLNLTNSTVSGNSSSQGAGLFLAHASGPTDYVLTNNTITNNTATSGGGGIHVFQTTIKLRNTIVAGNMSSGGTPDFFIQFGRVISLGNNLIGNSTNTGSGTGEYLPSDILNRDVRLAPLADNGGMTKTHALLPDSPAINAGNNCVLTANGCVDNNPAVPTDQRGAARVGNVDIGAFEYNARRANFDFDGDGKTDYAVFRPSTGIHYQLNSTAGFSAVQLGTATDKLAPADYDGDGKTDVAVFRSGIWYLLQSTDGFVQTQFGQAGDVPVPADFDGDGKADLAVYRNGGANGGQSFFFYLGTANNPNKNITFIPFGAGGDKPVVGDYDGDGKADPAIYRNGVWYLLRSQAGATAVQFGIATDKPTPADFDGDGKTDLAVYRNGVWYVLNSSNGQVQIVQFGISTDIPTVGDYDGDGKADFSVWRESNRVFYVLGSQSGFMAVQFGSSGDVPVTSAYIP